MTVEPALDHGHISAALGSRYGISSQVLEFLPLGADVRSFSYKCIDAKGSEFFVKLRVSDPDQAPRGSAVTFVMSHLECAISPLADRSGSSHSVKFDGYQLTVFPYVHGVSGWNYTLSPDQWRQIGRGVRSLHDLLLPAPLVADAARETFSPRFRTRLSAYLGTTEFGATDASGDGLIKLLRENKKILTDLIARAQALADKLSTQNLDFMCCHGDLHSGNFLIDDKKAHLIDWDTLSLAPKEKDLMFVEAGIGGMLDARDGGKHFYEGYGAVKIDHNALSYFRLERIVQDVVAYCEQLLDSTEGGADRATSLDQIVRQFQPGGVVEVACKPLGLPLNPLPKLIEP